MRIDYHDHPEIMSGMRELSAAAKAGTLEPLLLELVKVRASQINGCAHCLEMHTKDARAMGESDDRLYLVSLWREAPCFNARERAALAWCEELTLISERDVPDALYEEVRRSLSEDELCRLTIAIIAINGSNRLAKAFRASVGNYVSRGSASYGASS